MNASREKFKKFFHKPFVEKGLFILAAFLFLLLIWQIAYMLVGNDFLLPAPWKVMKNAGILLGNGGFYFVFFSTLKRAFLAFIFSFILAAILSVLSYTVRAFSYFLSPIISLLRGLPTMAVLLMILLWTSPKNAPIVISFLALFPILYSMMFSSLLEVDKGLLEMSKAYKVPVKDRIFKLYIPFVAPFVCREGGSALSFSLKLTVSAEVLANTFNSLGGEMQIANLYNQIPTLFALVVISFLTGFVLEGILRLLADIVERRVK